jgi:hypothetical protein
MDFGNGIREGAISKAVRAKVKDERRWSCVESKVIEKTVRVFPVFLHFVAFCNMAPKTPGSMVNVYSPENSGARTHINPGVAQYTGRMK